MCNNYEDYLVSMYSVLLYVADKQTRSVKHLYINRAKTSVKLLLKTVTLYSFCIDADAKRGYFFCILRRHQCELYIVLTFRAAVNGNCGNSNIYTVCVVILQGCKIKRIHAIDIPPTFTKETTLPS